MLVDKFTLIFRCIESNKKLKKSFQKEGKNAIIKLDILKVVLSYDLNFTTT